MTTSSCAHTIGVKVAPERIVLLTWWILATACRALKALRSQSSFYGALPKIAASGPSDLSMIPKTLLLVEQIRPATPQIDDLRTPIPILFQPGALKAVESVGDALATADDALVLVVAEGALVADADQGGGADVGVADGAFAVALVAEAADGYAGLLAAHDEISV